ncbi:NADP oxidoreductase coenzyme F420-dependent [Deinococcus aerius]|uniref:NADP oxidoreductase coenzyme F420-dependent n=1 Tax=Deinococcus aerius TaxID=200253 RepID=A0A2I9CT91_9DEIO|nr:NAD(P)-binding domain-containing protein [Deinococcus aerius]GBF04962.1 NADP oxidoreductase coenzyme F420-dependent [Deinococcus aerius]
MRVGIIGSGMVGQTLAADLVRLGHAVVTGTRGPGKLEAFVAEHSGVRAASNAEAAAFGEMVLLATNWEGTREALDLAGPGNLNGKVVVDITNPLDFSTGRPALALSWNTSAGEQVQGWIPGARVVKALNTVTADAMLKPREFTGGEPDMFIAGNDAAAKGEVTQLLESVGWGVVDLGDITMSRLIEPLALIWITHGFNLGWTKRNHAFKLLNR